MANRAQRRAAAKAQRHHGRVTDKKPRGAFVTVRNPETGEILETVPATEMTEEELEAQRVVIERSRQAAVEQEQAQMRLRAHVHGLWVPGDPIPGQR